MKIKGNSVGANKTRPDYNESDPKSAAYIKNKPPRIFVGNTVPEGPAIWFNTAPGSEASAANLLLEEDEEGHAVQAIIDDETYGVTNADVNSTATEKKYNFTVL